MRRDLSALAAREFDLVIIGGGIFGACTAWDATLRGLNVALLERRDFAHAASANCFKIVHGGSRYLQHADVVRVRQSSRERTALLRIAPHLVQPLPILVPTYGHGVKGKGVLAMGMGVYDLLTFDRNWGITDPDRRIPSTRLVSRAEALELFPDLGPDGLTGGVLFNDGQMYSPARLALCFLLSAAEAGAEVANHTQVTRFLREGERLSGVVARDTLSNQEFDVRGKVVLNAAGGWANGLLKQVLKRGLAPQPSFSRDAYFVIRRRLSERHALAVPARTRDPDALVSRSARHLLLVPWRDRTLVGVWHTVYDGDPDQAAVTEADLQGFIEEINWAYPALSLSRDEVALVHGGLVLFGENRAGATDLSYGKRSLVVDHARTDGIEGLITLIGVRYTTARAEAAWVVDLAFGKLGRKPPRCRTGTTPIYGGRIERFGAFVREAMADRPPDLRLDSMEALLRNHGSEYRRVLNLVVAQPERARTLGASATLEAEVIHAVREEMGMHLGDVVFRRTDLGTTGHPGKEALEAAAGLMARELSWEPSRQRKEVDEVLASFPSTRISPVAEMGTNTE